MYNSLSIIKGRVHNEKLSYMYAYIFPQAAYIPYLNICSWQHFGVSDKEQP